jgi:hypothetical protein
VSQALDDSANVLAQLNRVSNTFLMSSRGKMHLPATVMLVALAWLFLSVSAQAHEPSKSYLSLTLESERFTGKWDVPLRDLQSIVPFGLDKNGLAPVEQLQTRFHDLTDYAFSHLQIALDGRAVAPRLVSSKPTVEELSDGAYLQINFVLEHFPSPQIVTVNYQLFFETNSLHRGLLRIEAGGKVQIAAFSPDRPRQEFQLAAPSQGRQFIGFLREGIWHIWTGYDHILFLLALLLPSVLLREGSRWRGVNAFRPALYNVLKIVTAFTVAHSLTLSLATLGFVKLPSRFTESAIALSVALAAANNLWPVVRERGWIVAFVFGLIHGFGFATALSDLGLRSGSLLITLIGFNCGVELGQLAIVAVFLPVAFLMRRTWLYQSPLLQLGSACVIVVAISWCAERVLDLKFMPF